MADMVFLTKLKPEPMGAHDASKAYGVNSLVMSADGAAAYLSVKDVPAGVQLTNAEYWKIHTDLSKTKQSAEEAAAKAMAARDEMMEIARNLADPVHAEGNPVRVEDLVGGLPFDSVATVLEPKQAGGGEAAPDNIRSISGWTGTKLVRAGKNLFSGSPNKLISNGITLEKDRGSEVTVYGSAAITLGMRVFETQLPAGAYTFSIGEIGNVNRFEPCIDGTPIAQLWSGDTWTLTLEAAAAVGLNMIVSKNADCGTEDNPTRIKVQLESGVAATGYEPYQGLNLSADFGQTVYGGRLDWQTGELTIDRAAVTLNGTEEWNLEHENNWYTTRQYQDCIGGGTEVVSSMFPSKYGRVTAGNNIYISTSKRINVQTDAVPHTLDAFKALLAANPLTVVYPLSTPIEIPLTPQEIKQLEGTNTLYGDGGIDVDGRTKPGAQLISRIEALETAILNA